MRIVVIAVAGLLVGSCQWIPGQSAHEVKLAEERVAAVLRDPSSAQFRNARVVRQKSGESAVCGEVNAKNGFGGYTGFTGFVVFGDLVTLENPNPDYTSASDLAAATEYLRAHTDICIAEGRTIPEIEAETKRITEQTARMRSGG